MNLNYYGSRRKNYELRYTSFEYPKCFSLSSLKELEPLDRKLSCWMMALGVDTLKFDLIN